MERVKARIKMNGEQTKYEKLGEEVYTPLGRARIVYRFADGTYAVEFPHGGGHVFMSEELVNSRTGGPAMIFRDSVL